MLLIAVVLIYGLNLEDAFYWYIAAGIAAVMDISALCAVAAPIMDVNKQ